MKGISLACSLALLLSGAQAAREIVLFGDSLSDNGAYARTVKLALQTQATYPQDPYYEGRWSNGPTWIEHAAKALNSNLRDYGEGGATTGTVPAQIPPLPAGFAGLTKPTTVPANNLFQQINSYLLATNGTVSRNAVYIILIGLNDYFSNVFANTSVQSSAVVNNIQNATETLYRRGARDFILALPPTVSTGPIFTHPDLYGRYPADKVTQIDREITEQGNALTRLASQFANGRPNATARVYDFGKALVSIADRASSLGITNLKDACYVITPDQSQFPQPSSQPIGRAGGNPCPNPQNYLFWDQLHPSAVVHQAIGADFVTALGRSVFGVNPSTTAPVRAPTRAPTRTPAKTPARGPARGPGRGPTVAPTRTPTRGPVSAGPARGPSTTTG